MEATMFPYISVTTAIGSFSVSGLCVQRGYDLFLAGAQGAFKFHAQTSAGTVGLESVAPGIGFALAGVALALYTVHRVIKQLA
jgi:hypothetical protein